VLTDDLMERALDKLRPPRIASGSRPTLLLENVESMSVAHQLVLLNAIHKNSMGARIIATCGPCFPREELEDTASVSGEATETLEKAADGIRSMPATIDLALINAISTIGIRIPRLVDRLEDLPILSQFFLEACNRNGSKQLGGLRPEALDSLGLYSWPGELDQLRETIEVAHAACTSHEVSSADLPRIFHHAFRAATNVRRQPERIVLDELLATIEKEAIVRALAQAGGNKSEAALLLGMTRPRLYRRFVQLGLAGDESDVGEPIELPEFIEHDAAE
jgi:DNA-binding NtrC family response regulator